MSKTIYNAHNRLITGIEMNKVLGLDKLLNPCDSTATHIAVLEYNILLLQENIKRLEKELNRKKDK